MFTEDSSGGLHLLSRKTIAEAFWNAELEDELRCRGWIDRAFACSQSREDLMREVDSVRAAEVYPHNLCSDECKRRGISVLVKS